MWYWAYRIILKVRILKWAKKKSKWIWRRIIRIRVHIHDLRFICSIIIVKKIKIRGDCENVWLFVWLQAFEELEELLGKRNICIAIKEKLVKDSGVAKDAAYDNIVLKLLTKPRARGKLVFFTILYKIV